MRYSVSFLVFLNHLEEEERAGCFAFIVFRMSCYCNVPWLFLTMPWAGLQCVVVVFPDHTHLLFFWSKVWIFSFSVHHVRD